MKFELLTLMDINFKVGSLTLWRHNV